jgi:hypothetical protein
VASGWKRRFDEPIPLPRGRQLVTLEDAGNYITKAFKLPTRERDLTGGRNAQDILGANGVRRRAYPQGRF